MKATKEIIIQRKETRMIKDGEDSHRLQARNLRRDCSRCTKRDVAPSKLRSMWRSDSHLGVLQRTASLAICTTHVRKLTFKLFCLATFLLLLSLSAAFYFYVLLNIPRLIRHDTEGSPETITTIQGNNGSLSKKTKNAKPVLIESFPMQYEGM